MIGFTLCEASCHSDRGYLRGDIVYHHINEYNLEEPHSFITFFHINERTSASKRKENLPQMTVLPTVSKAS